MDIPIQNIYYMLIYAWNKQRERDIVNVGTDETTNLQDLFAKVLINGLNHLMKRGFDRDYRPISEDINTIKGKINFNVTIKRNLLRQGKANCEFDVFDEDNIQNQIIKVTLNNLILTNGLDNELKTKLVGLKRRFTRVRLISLNNSYFKSLTFNSNNKFYEFLLKVCEIIYYNLVPTVETGKYKFKKFTKDNMGTFFESFVRNFYTIEQEMDVKSEKLNWDLDEITPGITDFVPEMRTDISLEDDERKIIMDTKFYKTTLTQGRWGKSKIDSSHIYQIYSYLENVKLKDKQKLEGILLYPTIDEEYNLSALYNGHQISIKTINLNQEWNLIHRDLLNVIN
jgi:5-methylcytosine-specific restriction enzyme subunit McrC